MFTTWILIFFVQTGEVNLAVGSVGDFGSKGQCEAAAAEVKKLYKATSTVCVRR